jgi:hypothetical protein
MSLKNDRFQRESLSADAGFPVRGPKAIDSSILVAPP